MAINKDKKADLWEKLQDLREYKTSELRSRHYLERVPEPPKLVLSVIGDSSSFVPKPWLTSVFQCGLIEIAKGAKDCLILYKGSSEKVSSIVREAVLNFEKLHTETDDVFISLVGLLPQIDKSIECGLYDLDRQKNHKYGRLNVNWKRSDRVLGEIFNLKTKKDNYSEAHASILKRLSEKKTFFMKLHGSDLDWYLPILTIVAEGDLDTIESVFHVLKQDLPVLILKGTGKAADFIAEFIESGDSDPSALYAKYKTHFKKLSFISQAVQINGLMDKLMKIKEHECLVTLIDINEQTKQKEFTEVVTQAIIRGWSQWKLEMNQPDPKDHKQNYMTSDDHKEGRVDPPGISIYIVTLIDINEQTKQKEFTEVVTQAIIRGWSQWKLEMNQPDPKDHKQNYMTSDDHKEGRVDPPGHDILYSAKNTGKRPSVSFVNKVYPKPIIKHVECIDDSLKESRLFMDIYKDTLTPASLSLYYYIAYQFIQENGTCNTSQEGKEDDQKIKIQNFNILLKEAIVADRDEYVSVLLEEEGVRFENKHFPDIYEKTVLLANEADTDFQHILKWGSSSSIYSLKSSCYLNRIGDFLANTQQWLQKHPLEDAKKEFDETLKEIIDESKDHSENDHTEQSKLRERAKCATSCVSKVIGTLKKLSYAKDAFEWLHNFDKHEFKQSLNVELSDLLNNLKEYVSSLETALQSFQHYADEQRSAMDKFEEINYSYGQISQLLTECHGMFSDAEKVVNQLVKCGPNIFEKSIREIHIYSSQKCINACRNMCQALLDYPKSAYLDEMFIQKKENGGKDGDGRGQRSRVGIQTKTIDEGDHLKTRSAGNQPKTSSEGGQPEMSRKEEQPETSRREKQPETRKRKEQPETNRREEQPETSRREEQPETCRREEQPETCRSEEQPETSRREDQPETSRREAQTETCRIEEQPETSRREAQTETGRTEAQPETCRREEQAETNGREAQTETCRREEQPETSRRVDRPETCERGDKPEIRDEGDEPEKSSGVNQPDTSSESDEPETSRREEQPEASGMTKKREKDDDTQTSFEDLLLWAILVNRPNLATLFWMKCKNQLLCAVLACCVYKKIACKVKSGIDQSSYDIMMKESRIFENRAIDLQKRLYKDDARLAMDLVITEETVWDITISPLECAYNYNILDFMTLSCPQRRLNKLWYNGIGASLGGFWKKGLLTGCCCCCIYGLSWSLQRGRCCKCIPSKFTFMLPQFLISPLAKFLVHYTFFLAAMVCYSAFLLTELDDFGGSIKIYEWIVYVFFLGDIIEEYRHLILKEESLLTKISQPLREEDKRYLSPLRHTWWYGFKKYLYNFWNFFDVISYSITIIAMCFRFSNSTPLNHAFARRVYSLSLFTMYMRFLHVILMSRKLGPKIIMIKEMLKDLLRFIGILCVFMLGVGVLYHANMYPKHVDMWNPAGWEYWRIWKIMYIPYWQMYGDSFLDTFNENSTTPCTTIQSEWENNPDIERCNQYDWILGVIAALYMLISNLLLVNLVIALFSYRFERVQENSEKLWRYLRYEVIMDFKSRIPAPLNLIIRPLQFLFKRFKTKCIKPEPHKPDSRLLDRINTLQSIHAINCANNILS